MASTEFEGQRMTGTGFEVDLKPFRRAMSDIGQRQMPFAAALALNDTAKDVTDAWADHLQVRLDKPTPFTLKGTYVRRASKTRPVAEVGYKRVQAAYLRLQIEGGERRPKGRALVVPAGIKLNKYGNIPRGLLARSRSRGQTFATSRRNGRASHLPGGVYRRKARGKLQMLVAFEQVARYRKRIHLRDVAERKVRMVYGQHFRRRFAQAMLTAR